MSLGPLMMGLQGTAILEEEREMLRHPVVGGVILFTRNYASVEQLCQLTRELHALRDPHLIIAVDHEGGRVQRFRDGFSTLPPMSVFGKLYQHNHKHALDLAEQTGWLLAMELLACGLDISFTPVLDIAHDGNTAIGDRAFSADPDIITALAQAVVRGMRRAGMAAIGKHFPGHGGVKEDSHVARPVDSRPLEDLLFRDIVPFERLIHAGIAGIMPSHVIYEKVDRKPAGYSKRWLQTILREQLGFQGAVFTDDLSMKGADCGDTHADRVEQALSAGCDMTLVCNDQQAAVDVIERIANYKNPASQSRLIRMHGHPQAGLTLELLHQSAAWQDISRKVAALTAGETLEFNF